jgi:hypothetical protein
MATAAPVLISAREGRVMWRKRRERERRSQPRPKPPFLLPVYVTQGSVASSLQEMQLLLVWFGLGDGCRFI